MCKKTVSCFRWSDICRHIWPSAVEDADLPERQTSGLLAQREEDEEAQFLGVCGDVQVRAHCIHLCFGCFPVSFHVGAERVACCLGVVSALVVSRSSKGNKFKCLFCVPTLVLVLNLSSEDFELLERFRKVA